MYLTERIRSIADRRGWAIPPIVILVCGGIWDLWLLSGHASTAAWLWSVIPESARKGLHVPHLNISPWGPPLWMFIAGLVWLGILAFVPRRTPTAPIIGNADLLIVRLDLGDLHLKSFTEVLSADFGIFVRMFVAATDKPRTVRGFIFRATTIPDGITYTAESEREIGDYFYRHTVTEKDRGYMLQKNVEEKMADLAKILRTPLQPHTHVEGWIRFETNEVKHDLKQCRITIHALDAIGNQHEIETTNMTVKSVEDHEYAIARRQ